jgi:hypothetical protein
MSSQFHVKDGFKPPKKWRGHHGENPGERNPSHDRDRAGKKVSLHAFLTLTGVGKSVRVAWVLFSASPSSEPGSLLRSNSPIFTGMPLGC